MAAFLGLSPRGSCRSPRSEGRATLANFGALLPRPGQQGSADPGRQAASPWLSPRNTIGTPGSSSRGTRTAPRKGATGAALKQAMGTRGGVVREQDGFEVFYGTKPKSSKAKQDSRDGFDIFYGIKSGAKPAAAEPRAVAPVEFAPAVGAAGNLRAGGAVTAEQQRQLEAQLQSRFATPRCTSGDAPSTGGFESLAELEGPSGGCPSSSPLPGSQRPSPEARGVETYSLCGHSPALANKLPSSVASYNMASPVASFVPPSEAQEPQDVAPAPERPAAAAVALSAPVAPAVAPALAAAPPVGMRVSPGSLAPAPTVPALQMAGLRRDAPAVAAAKGGHFSLAAGAAPRHTVAVGAPRPMPLAAVAARG